MPHWSLPRPAISVQRTIHLAQGLGLGLEQCLAGSGLTSEIVAEATSEIEGWQELRVLRNILRLVDPSIGFGLRAGQRYHLTSHGMWGLLAVCSPDIRTAIEIGERYFDLSYSFNRVEFRIVGQEAHFVYDDSDNPEDLRAALIEIDMAALVMFGRDLAGKTIPIQSLHLRASRPPYAAAFESLFGLKPQFESEHNCMVVDTVHLALRQPMADEVGLRVCEDACRAQLARRGTQHGVAGKVRRHLSAVPGVVPSMPKVAKALGMSTRTLRYKLKSESTSFRALVEELRTRAAEDLLESQVPLDQVAQHLGYADTTTFVSAFKRWKGVTPGGYRSQRRI